LLEPLPERTQTAPPATSNTAAAQPATAAPAPGQLNQLFYQLQVLQQEVQELRGLVEEQSYQLNRLAKDQKEQYIDLDGRIARMTTASPAPARPASGGPADRAAATTSPAVVAAVPTGPAGSSDSERDTYTRAFDLMKARQFEESAAAFNQLIVSYPNGQYTPNAFYWLGELYLAQNETEQARQSFAQVLNLYPDHPKVPDTLYKMGVVYNRLGDNGQAETYFKQVIADYPSSSAAGLASRYMAELQ
jgi:tol-pal system protein YbgF